MSLRVNVGENPDPADNWAFEIYNNTTVVIIPPKNLEFAIISRPDNHEVALIFKYRAVKVPK